MNELLDTVGRWVGRSRTQGGWEGGWVGGMWAGELVGRWEGGWERDERTCFPKVPEGLSVTLLADAGQHSEAAASEIKGGGTADAAAGACQLERERGWVDGWVVWVGGVKRVSHALGALAFSLSPPPPPAPMVDTWRSGCGRRHGARGGKWMGGWVGGRERRRTRMEPPVRGG